MGVRRLLTTSSSAGSATARTQLRLGLPTAERRRHDARLGSSIPTQMDRGVIYVSIGADRYRETAVASAWSLRRWMPDLEIALASDDPQDLQAPFTTHISLLRPMASARKFSPPAQCLSSGRFFSTRTLTSQHLWMTSSVCLTVSTSPPLTRLGEPTSNWTTSPHHSPSLIRGSSRSEHQQQSPRSSTCGCTSTTAATLQRPAGLPLGHLPRPRCEDRHASTRVQPTLHDGRLPVPEGARPSRMDGRP